MSMSIKQMSPVLVTDSNFDEALYLAANPDVALAVKEQRVKSGRAHFEAYGRHEGRVIATVPLRAQETRSRRERFLSELALTTMRGLEIGPLDRPIVRKNEGDIYYVDWASAETLRERYKNDPMVDGAKILEVDFVLGGGKTTIAQAVGARRFQYVVASHVIEHVPDLVGWLNEIERILEPGGRLCLAIPDRRYTFDFLRSETTVGDAVDAHLRKLVRPSCKAIFDFYSCTAAVDAAKAWSGAVTGPDLVTKHDPSFALAVCREAMREEKYHDVHCWIFTPRHFLNLLGVLFQTRLVGQFKISYFLDTAIGEVEFFVHLERLDEGLCDDERKALQLASVASCASSLGPDRTRGVQQLTQELAQMTLEVRTLAGELASIRNARLWRFIRPAREALRIGRAIRARLRGKE